jgi:hypothetical protein
MKNIIVSDPKIVDFYTSNKNINFEAVNLIFIDLFEKLLNDIDSTMNSTINSQILSVVNEIKNDFSSMQQNVIIKFQDSKKEYIEETKNIVLNNNSLNNEKIQSILTQHNSQLIDKTNILLNDIVPKYNNNMSNQIQQKITELQTTIDHETSKLINSTDKQQSIERFISEFDNKTNNLLQPLFSFINASEERISKNINSINQDKYNSVQDKVFSDLSEFLNKYKNSSYKGQFGENHLESVLNKLFPTAEVINTTGIKASCDFRVNREDLPTILFETKNYDRNVTLDEVKKFIRDINERKCHGIFLSQHSGITSKQNYQIDIIGQNIVVYVHYADYSPQNIKIATDIIDSLSIKLENIIKPDNDISISKQTIDDINKEYSKFIEKKTTIIESCKDFNKKILAQVDDIKFPCLSKILSNNCGNILNDENNIIICNLCNKFKATSNKSLSAHQRGCKKKFSFIPEDSNLIINTNNSS